jgi:Cu(I)/Ag(I) efflux system periplasmic protein CusF
MKTKLFFIAAAVMAVFAIPFPAPATSHAPGSAAAHAGHHALADGEIRRVDKEQKKLTIRHGPIQSLDMPPMTMVFQVRETAMLEAVKAGDKVKFQADKIEGAYTVTHIEPAQ